MPRRVTMRKARKKYMIGAKLDANPAYQKVDRKLKEKVNRNHEQLEYRKNEILNGRIPDLNKYENEN